MERIKSFHYIFLIFIILFSYLGFHLFQLQLVQNDKYLQIAEKNFVRIKKIKPIRGQIYDQKYRPIAINQPSLNLYVNIGKIKDRKRLSDFVCTELNQDYDFIFGLMYRNRFRTYQDVMIVQNIPKDIGVQFAEKMDLFPELFFQIESVREYQFPNHFTGYVGKIDEKEYKKKKEQGYLLQSLIGKNGLEKMYEDIMRGELGYEVVQVDARGKNLGFFKNDTSKPAKKGDDIILHIDSQLQNYIHEEFPKGTDGAVVVLDVKSGGILSYVSEPVYDPNIFMSSMSMEDWINIRDNELKPMLDRISQAAYPPGSIFKPITGAIGIDLGLTTPTTKLSYCAGGMQVGNRFFKCWLPSGHGKTNLVTSLQYSCDVYYYSLSMKYTMDQLYDYAQSNFMAMETGIDLPGERSGFFPSEKWFKDNYGRYVSITGQKVNLSIGQGEILTTPIQMAAFYAAIANDGLWKTPHFLDKTLSQDNQKFKDFMPYEEKEIGISKEALKTIQKGLYNVVNKPGGTARVCAIPGMTVYGKTGSAENHHGGKTHAWFAGYAAWEEPEIAILVFFETAGHGGSVAAPFAAKILSYYQQRIRE